MFLYRDKPKIIANHIFHDDSNPVVHVSDTVLTVINSATGAEVTTPALNVDANGRIIAIFDRATLPLGTYEFTWSSATANAINTEIVNVVGYPYFALYELRESEAAQFINDDSVLLTVRELVEQRIESLIGRSFRPTYQRETLTLGAWAVEPTRSDVREVLSATYEGQEVETQINAGHIEVIDGSVRMRRGEMLAVEYRYGADMNADIKRACLLLAQEVLRDAPDNVTSRTTSDGIFERFIIGGVGNAATSLPEVNEIIERYKRRV